MPGHNGGFNPYRDQNGEFTTPTGAGKPGRSRKGSSGGSSYYGVRVVGNGKSRDSDGVRYRTSGGPRITKTPTIMGTRTDRSNPSSVNQRFAQTYRSSTASPYRAKGTNIYGETKY